MKRLKVMTIVGTRPEIIKLSRVIAELDRHCDHVLVHSGQNFDYELNGIFFEHMNIRQPDHFLEAVGDTVAETIGQVISKSDSVMARESPDAVLFYGDTNTCLAVIAAKRRKIPVFHMEAGNRCFDERVPEEINRRVVDHLSDINMPLTEHGRRYLLREGIAPETVIKIGSTMSEVLDHHRADIDSSKVLESLSLTPGEYFVVSAHREENVDSEENLSNLLQALIAIGKSYAKRIVFSTHPRTRKRLESRGMQDVEQYVDFIKPLSFIDFVKLQKHAFCVISDSGTLTEEASILDLPAVMIRQAHERPEGMDEGAVVMSGLASERILQAIELVTTQAEGGRRIRKIVDDYDAGKVSEKVVRIILSYVDYVNRTVWRRSV